MNTPEIQPISWGDRFKVKQNFKVFETNKTYVINGIGGKWINGTYHKCWNILGGIDEMLIPIETLTALYNKGLISNL